MMSGVDDGVEAVCMVGYHSRAQGRGILAHTINSFAFSRVWFNEAEVGEAAIYGALAGQYGVPVVMASGDDAFIEEHQPLFPGATFVQTKRATGQTSGISLSPTESCGAIRQGVADGLGRRAHAQARVLPGPIAVRIQTQAPAFADLFGQWPALARLAGDEIGFEAPTVEHAVRMINCLSAMSAMLR
jgi:D-amino peptidase